MCQFLFLYFCVHILYVEESKFILDESATKLCMYKPHPILALKYGMNLHNWNLHWKIRLHVIDNYLGNVIGMPIRSEAMVMVS